MVGLAVVPDVVCIAWIGEAFGEEPDREDQLEDTARDQRHEPDALGDVGEVEQVQDAARQQRGVADEPERGEGRGMRRER